MMKPIQVFNLIFTLFLCLKYMKGTIYVHDYFEIINISSRNTGTAEYIRGHFCH